MHNYRVVTCALVVGTVLDMAACKPKPHAALSEQKSNQVHGVNPKAPDSPDEKSCRVFVQRFYDWRVSLNVDMFCSNSLKGSRASQEAIEAQEEECGIASLNRHAEKLGLNKVLSRKLLHTSTEKRLCRQKTRKIRGWILIHT
jgi:hypothetical protein